MILTKPNKSSYTANEAAVEIGVSIEEFRTLIRSHIVDREEDLGNIPIATFQPSDLALLRILAKQLPSQDAA